jgi:hypothetical protein
MISFKVVMFTGQHIGFKVLHFFEADHDSGHLPWHNSNMFLLSFWLYYPATNFNALLADTEVTTERENSNVGIKWQR